GRPRSAPGRHGMAGQAPDLSLDRDLPPERADGNADRLARHAAGGSGAGRAEHVTGADRGRGVLRVEGPADPEVPYILVESDARRCCAGLERRDPGDLLTGAARALATRGSHSAAASAIFMFWPFLAGKQHGAVLLHLPMR